jgi:hypothetical protein
LLGADPYFQDIQRFQDGGLAGQSGIAGTDVPYSALQAAAKAAAEYYNPAADLGPYGASRTAAQRGRSIMGFDPLTTGVSGVGKVLGGPLGWGIGALTAGIGAYKDVSEANLQRAGALPPEAYEPLGFWDSLKAMMPWTSYEDAITDKDLETMSKYGMGLAAGVGGDLVGLRGGYSLTGPRISTGMTNQEYEAMKDRERQFDMLGWMYNLSGQIAQNKEREFEAQRIDPLKGARVFTRDLPRVGPRPTVTVENLPPPDRWADYQADRHGIVEAADRAAAQKAAKEFAAWAEPDADGSGTPSGITSGEDTDPGGGYSGEYGF